MCSPAGGCLGPASCGAQVVESATEQGALHCGLGMIHPEHNARLP